MKNKDFLIHQVRIKLQQCCQNETFLRYLIGGGLITFINLGLYSLLVETHMKVRWANLIALIVAKVSGFFINKYYVYQTKTIGLENTGSEAGKYIITRGLTGVFDYVAILVLVEFLQFPALLTKYVVTGVIIISNYVLMKYVVFTTALVKSQVDE